MDIASLMKIFDAFEALIAARLSKEGHRPQLICHLERRTLFWPGLPVIVEAGRRDVGMPEPLLDLSNVGPVIEGVGSGCRTQNMTPIPNPSAAE